MPKFILNSGFKGSGKDTLGEQIKKKLVNFKRYAFADTLKDIAAERYGFDRKLADIHEEKDKPRPEYGGRSIRELGREVWLEIKEKNPTMLSEIVYLKIKEDLKNDNTMNFVITDFRYDFDYNTIVKYFGKESVLTVRINKNVEPPNEEKEPEEYALKNFKFDVYVDNNGTFEQLWINFISSVDKLKPLFILNK
jgi:hypothetical protein